MSLESNPYDPPVAPIGRRGELREFEIAGKGRRFGTFIIDQIISTLTNFVIGFVLGMIVGEEGVEKYGALFFLVGIASGIGYFVFFEGLMARTPGKFICGTKVIDQDGGPASFGQILGRTACRFIPFEPFSFLGVRGWHDSISKTSVVLAR